MAAEAQSAGDKEEQPCNEPANRSKRTTKKD